MRSLGVVPLDPLSNGSAGFGEVAEVVLPNTLLLEIAKEALHDPVLLRRLDHLWLYPQLDTKGI